MRGTGEDGMAGVGEMSNLRFLVGQQLRVIDELDRRGLDGRAALDLLARLMRRHQSIACADRTGPSGTAVIEPLG